MKEIVKNNLERWLNSPKVSQEDKAKLNSMNEKELDDAFFKNIAFGTAGLRGVLGPGTNRMNYFTILKATVGFGLYLKELYKDLNNISVAISHDNRHFSREFTLESAKILNEMGINTYIFDALRPTPELSYAVRYKKCQGGIMITASHNPKQYNGYKVYDEEGCQLVPSKIARLIEIINSLNDELNVEVPEVENKGKNEILGQDVDDTYVENVEKIVIDKSLDKSNFKIVYSPNHGTSYVNAMRVFKDEGYDVYPVVKQCSFDPDFSATLSPNPEDPRAFIEGIKLAKEIGAEQICMTDPDGDRVGLATKLGNGEFALMTGNESAAILLDYILDHKKKNGEDLSKYVVYNTVVSSMLGKAICDYYGVRIESFLTGFKYIGDRIHYYEENNGYEFLFGYEESYGCLASPFVRDKDGIQAILLYSEMGLAYHLKGKNLVEAYDEICQKVNNFYHSKLFDIYFEGSEGQAKMDKIMENLEKNPFKELLGNKVKFIENYFTLTKINLDDGSRSKIENLPNGDLVKFYFEDSSNIAIRPSGTEPKCKFYIEVCGKNRKETEGKPELYFEELKNILL